LAVPADAPTASTAGPLAPVEGRITPENDDPPGEVILFVENGQLKSMEHVFYTEVPPAHWPEIERLSTVQFDR
jgi:hypothetical protein